MIGVCVELLLFREIKAWFNNAWVESPEFLSSMYVRSIEGKRLDGNVSCQFKIK